MTETAKAPPVRMSADGTIVGNIYDKYNSTNPVVTRLFRGFLGTIRRLSNSVTGPSLLEVGCGEGRLAELFAHWRPGCRITGIDLEPELVERPDGERRFEFAVQSAYNLGFGDGVFDLVVAAEVLEHLECPDDGLAEIVRVSAGYALLSVPREPLWRVLNLARGAYWSDWGNTPGHLQHWSTRDFVEFVSRRLEVVQVESPTPWTVVLARKP